MDLRIVPCALLALSCTTLPGSGEDARENVFYQNVEWSTDGKRIAYSEYAGGDEYSSKNWSIWVANADGSNRKRLAGDAIWPSWSPDGEKLVFSSRTSGEGDLYLVDANGNNLERLTDDPAKETTPAWSPLGTAIAFTSKQDGNEEIYLLDVASRETRRLTRDPANDLNPQWSPDGGALVFFREIGDGKDQIVMIDLEGNETRITRDDHLNVFPSFLPDGRIAYSSKRGERESLVVVDLTRGTTTELRLPDVYFGRWSPRGNSMLFLAGRWPKSSIYTARTDGSNPKRLAPSPADPSLARRLEAEAESFFSRSGPGGVILVARDGETLLRGAYGMADLELDVPMRPEHVLSVGSITKQITAVAILQLVSRGELSLGDEVQKHLPGVSTQGHRVTIEQVLSHTSGLPSFVDRDDFPVLSRRDHTVDELLGLTRDMPLLFEPGAGYSYSDTGYILLGAIIERISGTSYASYIEEQLFRPIGMTNSWYGDDARIIPRRAAGYTIRDGVVFHADPISMTVPHAAGAVFSSVDDLRLWNSALKSGKVIPIELLERARTSTVLRDGTPTGYGFGWKTCSLAGSHTIEHGGFLNGYQASMIDIPEEDLTVIVLVNNDADDPNPGVVGRRLARLVLTGSSAPPYDELDEAERAALAGTYRTSRGKSVEITDDEGIMNLVTSRGGRIRLRALSETELTFEETEEDFVLTFRIGPDGRATAFAARLRCEIAYDAVREYDRR